MFMLGGLRVIIEGKFADTPNAEGVVLGDAHKRVQSGICHIAVAVVYPKPLRTVATAKLEETLSVSRLRFLVVSETGQTEWAEATPSEVLAALRRVQDALIKDDIVAESAKKLSDRIEGIAALWAGQTATCDKLSILLGMPVKRGETAEERNARRTTATKVASLVLANAMIFQEQLASSGGDGRVDSLRAYDNEPDPAAKLKNHWRWIWTKINYVPIFQIGESILQEIPVSKDAITSIRWLMGEAKSICANQSALRHDLMGRIYHWLLHHAKYLGTYYTGTAAATLLLKLTFAQNWGEQDFGTPKKLADFAVADLACGTGTLLMAAAQAVTDQFVISRVKTGRTLTETDLKHLHEALMENMLFGYDVLPSAIHLTASTLGMLAPHVTYRKMNLFVMPMGAEGRRTLRLGSLDFAGHRKVDTQLTFDQSQMEVKRTGVTSESFTVAEVPSLDLCVMNPPFVRSVGGNLLFGSLPDDERAKLQTELKRRVRTLQASITAGLGSVFLAVADKHLRVGGRVAFILPVALATGEAWGTSRQLLAEGYHVEVVMVSHDADRHNFSENTDLSEIMFIARKLRKGETAGETVYVNLWRNPRTIYEAMDVAERIRGCQPARLASKGTTSLLGAEGRKLAEVVTLPPAKGTDQWVGVQFAQTLALRTAVMLEEGKLIVPGQSASPVGLCSLEELGSLGPDRKRVHEGFTTSETDWSPYPAFWNHDAKKVLSLKQSPNTWLTPWEQSPRGPDYGPRLLWPRAGRILLVERVRTTTHRVLAVGFDQVVLGNTCWPLRTELTPEQEKVLLLWLNSTPALLLMLSRRVTTEGAWMQVKQPAWATMPVLDVRTLPASSLAQLAAAYDAVCTKKLLALAKLDSDPVRAEIDGALSATLGFPDMGLLRQLIAREPGLTGKGLSHKPGQATLFPEADDKIVPSPQLRLL
jgi:hypothetical protein